MTKLEQELINIGEASNEYDANLCFQEMFRRVKNGFEDPEEVLEEYGIDGDFIEDLLGWKQYNPNRKEPNPSPSEPASSSTTLPHVDEKKMMFKIKALLDKAASSDSQEESDAFMMKAQELIQKHSLDHERIIAVKGEKRGGIIVDEAIIGERVKYEEDWDRKLIVNMAVGNMCKVIYNTSESRVYIIGKASNAEGVVMMIDFYKKCIMNLAVNAAKKKSRLSKLAIGGAKGRIKSTDLIKIEKDEVTNIKDYLFGAVDGLEDALNKKTELFMDEQFPIGSEGEEVISGKEIIRKNVDKIDEYIRNKYPRLGYARFGSRGGDSNSSSYARGHADGGGLGSGVKRLQ